MAVLLGVASATLANAGDPLDTAKQTKLREKPWSDLPGLSTLADVPESEPNNPFVRANAIQCGDVFRPASISSGGAPRDSDYVSFTANAGDLITFGTDADGTDGQVGDTYIRLLAADGITVLASDDDSGPLLYSLITAFPAPYTGTYYGEIHGYGVANVGAYQAFVTCQAPQPPPPNDQCSGAIPIACGPIDIAGSTQFASNDYSPPSIGSCTGFTAAGRDVVYRLDVAGGDSIAVDYQSTADGSIYIVTACDPVSTTCVVGRDTSLTGGLETLRYRFGATGTFYLILDSYGTDTFGSFTAVGELVCQPVGVPPHRAPVALELRAIEPNPFVGSTTLRFAVPSQSQVRLTIFDLEGRLVRVLEDRELEAGEHVSVWDGKDAHGRSTSAGVYLARLSSAEREIVRRLVFVR